MRSLTLLKSLTAISFIAIAGCESDQPQVDLCFYVNTIDNTGLDSPYFGCSDPKGKYYEIDFRDVKANLYRAVSPDDFDRLRKYYGGKPDSSGKKDGAESN